MAGGGGRGLLVFKETGRIFPRLDDKEKETFTFFFHSYQIKVPFPRLFIGTKGT